MAQNNNTNRNRKEDAARIMSTLIALRNTQDLAAKVEARTAEHNEFLMDAATALIQAPAKEAITNQCFTAGHTRYNYSENGVYAALTALDTLQRNMAESQDAANRMPALVDDYLGTIATVLGIDMTQNESGPLHRYLANNGITDSHTQNEPAETTEIGTTGDGDFDPVNEPVNDATEDGPWDNCCNCPDKGDCEVCQACADYVDLGDDEDEIQEEDDADEPRYVTGDQLSAILTEFAASIHHLIPQPVPQPVQPIPAPAPVSVMPALTPEEMAVLDTGDIDASEENETVNIGDISETVSMLNDNQVAAIDGDGIATVTGDINLNITFNGDVNIND